MRIVSLLPSATEIVGGLGLESHLVGVSHECDVAPTADRLRAVLEAGCARVTTSDIDPHALPQGEIDRRVKEALKTGGDGALYGVDAAAVARAAPTVLLTQTLCGVCAPATSAVEAVLAASNVEPVVANLEPTTIDDAESLCYLPSPPPPSADRTKAMNMDAGLFASLSCPVRSPSCFFHRAL